MAKISFSKSQGEVPGKAEAAGTSTVPGEGQAQGQAQNRGQGQEQAPSLIGGRQGKSLHSKDDFGPNYGYDRIRFHKKDEVNVYAASEDARIGIDPRLMKVVYLGIATVLVFFFSATLPTQIFSNLVHPSGITPAVFLSEWAIQLQGFVAFLTGQVTNYTTYVWQVVAALFAGAALGLVGGVYQGAMKNALAAPSTLGINNGGQLGIIIYGLFVYTGFAGSVSEYQAQMAEAGLWENIMAIFGGFFCSLIGCFVVVVVVMVIAMIAGRGKVSNVSLVIAGQVFGAVITVVINWLRYYFVTYLGNENLDEVISTAQTATFSGIYTPTTVLVFIVPIVICMVIVFASSSRLSLLAFNDEEARSMGISTARTRNMLVALATIMTAMVISFTGAIGFVGFMVPHIARRLIGPEFRHLLPSCALLGAILVVGVHYVSYLGIPGIAVGSTGVFTSIIGCIMFIVMALRTRENKNAEWF